MRLKHRTARVAIALLLLATAFLCGAKVISSAQAKSPAEELWAPHPSDSSYYTEQWSLSFWATDGTYLHAQFISTNLGLGHQSAVKFETTAADGTRFSKKEKTDEHYEPEGQTYTLRFGKNSLKAEGGRVALHLELGGRTLTLDSRTQSADFKPGAPLVSLKGGSYDIRIISPQSTFSGRLRGEGRETALHGTGMIDHSWTTLAPQKLAKRWFKIKVVDADLTCLLTGLATPESKQDIDVAWIWLKTATGAPFFSRQVRVRFEDSEPDQGNKAHYPLPGLIRIEASAAERLLSIELRPEKMLRRKDILSDLGVFERMIVGAVSRPMDYTYRAQASYHLSGGGADLRLEKQHNYVLQFINP